MPRSPHPGRLLTLLGPLLLALPSLAVPVATAHAAPPAPPAAPVAAAAAAPVAARATGSITGWAAAPSTVRAGSSYVARVRVPGGERPVRLQRRVSSQWRTVASVGSSDTGLVRLRWTAPRSGGRVVLRVLAPRSGSRDAVATAARSVTVRRPATLTGTLSSLLRDVLVLVNDARASGYTCGGVRYPAVPALRVDARLTRAADKFARLMATEDFFSHDSPDGSSPGDRIEAEGYAWRTYGENIAAGYGTAAAVVDGWLHSEGHCTNLMNGAFTEIGLGQAYDADSTYGRYWVQDFGTPR